MKNSFGCPPENIPKNSALYDDDYADNHNEHRKCVKKVLFSKF
jgi:hypothetical protein